ncbi:MAG: hypothetical protein AB8B96_19760 [Lysobacterales bacterium]
MDPRSASARLKIWLFCIALLSAQLVLADHAYQHQADHHPASCELCLHGGGDDATTCSVALDPYPTPAISSPDGSAPLFAGVPPRENYPIRAPPGI